MYDVSATWSQKWRGHHTVWFIDVINVFFTFFIHVTFFLRFLTFFFIFSTFFVFKKTLSNAKYKYVKI